ncbi:MAG: hypothetical protein ACKOBY_00850 [Cyanobium sp.]
MAGAPQLKPPLAGWLAGAALLAGAAVLPAPPEGHYGAAAAGLRPALGLQAKGATVPIRQGEDYRLVRRRLLAQGWRPQKRPPEPDCSLLPGDRRCALFPELASCATTGLGFCRFDWLSPGGVPYAVITQGGSADGRPGLIARWFISR